MGRRVENPEDLRRIKEERLKEIDEWMKRGPVFVVGYGTSGIAAGADKVIRRVVDLVVEDKVMKVGCIGMRWGEPLLDVVFPDGIRIFYKKADAVLAEKVVESALKGEIYERNIVGYMDLRHEIFGEDLRKVEIPLLWNHDFYKKQVRVVLKNCGIIDPENIYDYIAVGGYSSLAKALFEMSPEDVIEEIKRSGLRGKGGAGFPTYLKWRFLKDTRSDVKYLVCNADEGDPGAFMDRATIEGDPHSILEGMLIAAYATEATKGFIYIRAEYPLAVKRQRP